ncbi:MAG: hypothetical protein IPI88_12065 [Chitinophagaceae bacterium]|nr:hypothetical protein [Chitinophagaceae bacterium]
MADRFSITFLTILNQSWAGLILSRFDNYIKSIPKPVFELYSIIDTQDNWKNAHSQFSKIRQFLLDHKTYQPEAYLVLAENVAKVTYNASNEPAPFDNNSGWWIPSCALQAATYFEDNKLEEEVKSCILIFNHNKHLKNRLTVAKDFLFIRKLTTSFGMSGIQSELKILRQETNIKVMFLIFSI